MTQHSKSDLEFPNLLSNGKCHSVSWEKDDTFSHSNQYLSYNFLVIKLHLEFHKQVVAILLIFSHPLLAPSCYFDPYINQ